MYLQSSPNAVNTFRPPNPTPDPARTPPGEESQKAPPTQLTQRPLGEESHKAPPTQQPQRGAAPSTVGRPSQKTHLVFAEIYSPEPVVGLTRSQEAAIQRGARKTFPSNEDYDPYKHRVVDNPTSNSETLVHVLKSSLGTGILAMPHAIALTGYVVGAFSTFAIGAIGVYCLHILLRSQYVICKRTRVPLVSYPQTMMYALTNGPPWLTWLAPASCYIVEGFLIFYQIGICACYIVFVATNMKQVWDFYYSGVVLDVRLHMFFLVIPLILLNCVRNLKLLAPFSTLANLITFIGLGIILYYVLTDVPPLTERDIYGGVTDYALFFGIVLFALEAVGVIIALESNMKNPADFRGTFGILNIGLGIIIVLYAVIGVLGYLKYGSDCKGSITLNLPQNEILAQSVKITMALAVFISYALQCYVPITVIWRDYMLGRLVTRNVDAKHQDYWNYGLRASIVVLTFIMGAIIPRLGVFIALVGALALSMLGLVFPATIELCVYWYEEFEGRCHWRIAKDTAIIIFGFLGLVLGTYAAFVDLVQGE